MPGTNTLAYFIATSVAKKKRFFDMVVSRFWPGTGSFCPAVIWLQNQNLLIFQTRFELESMFMQKFLRRLLSQFAKYYSFLPIIILCFLLKLFKTTLNFWTYLSLVYICDLEAHYFVTDCISKKDMEIINNEKLN